MKEEKCCNTCSTIKNIREFTKNKALKSGIDNMCKQCKSKKFKEWSLKNNPPKEKTILTDAQLLDEKLKRKEYKRNYYLENKNSIRTKQRRYYVENSESKKEYAKKYNIINKDKIKYTKLKYSKANKEKISEKKRVYAKKNSQRHKEYLKRDKIEKSHIYNAYNAKRRAIKKAQLHPNTNPLLERVLYEKAKRLAICIGIPYVVDHIIPLASGGPHHHLNLQVIPTQINLRKKDNVDFTHPNILTVDDLPPFIKNFKLDFNF